MADNGKEDQKHVSDETHELSAVRVDFVDHDFF